jgi:TPR repeat protein
LLYASRGDTLAQCNLGKCYKDGDGVTQDENKAIMWLERSSKKGCLEASYHLAIIYLHTCSQNKNPELGFKTMLECTTSNHAEIHRDSNYEIGLCYIDGLGVEKDYNTAISYLSTAEAAGCSDAAESIGFCYHRLNQHDKCLEWYQKSANNGSPNSMYNLALFYYKGFEGFPKNMTKAFEWAHKAAVKGHALSQKFMANCYLNGLGTEQDIAKCFAWCLKAASSGDIDCMKWVASYYNGSHGAIVDKYECIKWLFRLAEKGHHDAFVSIANQYLLDKNIPQAIAYLLMGAKRGHIQSQLKLAVVYSATQPEKSFDWFMKAAEQNSPEAQHAVGIYYENGIRVEKDLSLAVEWYKKSAEQGYKLSIDKLGPSYANKRQKV